MKLIKSPPAVHRFLDLKFIPRFQDGNMANIAEISSMKDNTKLGTGFARFTDAKIEWTVQYDEVVLVIDGNLHIQTTDKKMHLSKNDSVWLPQNTKVTYIAENALVFYALYPSDWLAK